MQIVMQRPQPGKLLYLGLGLLLLSSCRSSQPPAKEICILDGFGAGDCIESDGSTLYRSPSAMKNYWATNEADMQNFSAWCYDTNADTIQAQMFHIKENISK